MHQVFSSCKAGGKYIHLHKYQLQKRHDLWAGTPLAGFHSMQWDRHFQLIVECASNSTAASAAAKYFVNERTVDRVFDQFREYCQKYLERIQFYDGEDKEIDEFVGARVKYHRGEPTKGTTKWFFSIRGRQSRIFRCFYILGRSIEEVQPLINKYCKIGDTVYSDGLATYKHLSSTFVHKSVNHSEHFADPEDPTNNINGLEGSHGALRKKTSVHGSIQINKKQLYFDFYCLQRQFGHDPIQFLDYVWPSFDE
ncbi:Conserved_hypothetical protein [Hexamita inflata]|uniref:ISXO2-like transposase domain-containing protein n=1 Tax=Hexamita inflata TaxID=28002 RepID=A0AA86PIE9_9EUKA|nr:Conserved hypothetical protein [Hexamita inflata]CAI9955776.1 Conserved hypothetical protein [Hexamita inflata]